ncbi:MULTISPECIES: hypothetical protein [unclassified Psychrobacter]|nr:MULTISPECIES: hypothetical protein [unclassified Psychrobacter]
MTKPNPRVLEVKGVFVEPASAASIGGAIRDMVIPPINKNTYK